jgi:2,3-bisphosphoglycerate-dependent phosphoglycerate mutase
MDNLSRVVVVRHGESTFNAENRFTGWIDCGLTRVGVQEAQAAGAFLRQCGFRFDRIYTSVLNRCIESARVIGEGVSPPMPAIVSTWRLNERHYGALQGLNKAETAERFGEEQVRLWRRSYDARPPSLNVDDPSNPAHDTKYAHVPTSLLPLTESLANVVARVVPFWREEIAPVVADGVRVLIVGHGNSIRALVKYLDGIPDAEIVTLNIPTGRPFVYEMDGQLRPIAHYYLGEGPVTAPDVALS